MNIYLVYVRDETYFQLLPEKLNGSPPDPGRVKVMAFPPLGIQTLAPILRLHGHHVRMFDTCHPQMKAKHIVQAAREDRPDIIALSFLSVTAYSALQALAKRLKAKIPDIPIIVGGAFASMNSDLILVNCADVDYVGVGEGEELLPDFLRNIGEPSRVAGLVWRHAGKIIHNAPRPLIQDLDQFPYPDRSSLPIDYIESLPLDVPAVLSLDKFCTMQTSRGCPYHCIYCDIPSISQGKWRSRSAAHVLGEMQQLNDAGYRSIYLTDDHFLLNRKRINDICGGIIDRKFEFRWGCEGRVDSVAIDQFPIMRKANCNMLAFGIEAGTQRVLDRLGKDQTLAQIEHAVGEAKRQGIARVHGFFVIGSPGETADDVRKTFQFATRLQLDTFGFNRLSVYRGTPLWKEYVERDIIEDQRDWYKSFKCCDIDPTTLSSAMVNRLRMKGYGLLFAHRLLRRPFKTWHLLQTFSRYMKRSDLLKLLYSPFRRQHTSRKPELPAKMIDSGLDQPVRCIS
ncbi:MAG TPA: radical SAM protein [Nitrospirota bacterium]|nr:radical SAM protein [Nitrospirota bacterium]